MMDELMRTGEEIRSGLREFLQNLEISRAIRGVILDVDDFWESTELHNRFRYTNFPYQYLARDYQESSTFRSMSQAQSLAETSHTRPKLSFRPDTWGKHIRAMGYPDDAQPIIIRVILKESSRIEKIDLPRNYKDYAIVYEFRPPNRALTTFGQLFSWSRLKGEKRVLSIGRSHPNTAGTLGGILGAVDPRRKYLVTCAHVLGPPNTKVYQPGPMDGKHYQPIGTVSHWKIPPLGATHNACSEPSTPDAGRLDLAIAELTASTEWLQTAEIATAVNCFHPIEAIRKNDLVSFLTKRGRIEARIGALTLWDQIEFPDGVRCFGHIFEIKPPTREYIRQDLAQPGDSGSWLVCQLGDLVTWYGMVISCDGGQAYACFAEYILDECKACSSVFPDGLRLLS